MECPECQLEIPEDSKFCKECGHHLVEAIDTVEAYPATESERKHVTIMFSDLSGYTAMTERLDPEEVKEIMSLIFGKITEIIQSYDGFIEKFIGDAVMVVFGVPKAHEDDPIRAIRAAMEIRAAVEGLSPQFEGKIGRPLTMHTGINAGLVVTGEVDVEKGTHGLTGDAINLASRLEGIAKAGEIIVGPDTYNQALNYFEFEALEPSKFKGKQKPVSIYKVLSAKKESFKTHRLQGLQAALTGRDQEMKLFAEAADRLKEGQGAIISIYGDAGTGKSRLKKEFKDTLDLEGIQWREGHAYGYTQNMPYYPLINLLTHAFQIDEGDPPERLRAKVESGVAYLLDEGNKYTPYIGSLFALNYPEIEGVTPEYWKAKLQESIQVLLAALIDKGPTIVCFEDLHWADPSFIGLLKLLLRNISPKALFICTYRSHFTLFDSDLSDDLRGRYQEICLNDLATIEAQEMLESLLGTQSMPAELYEVVRKKAEGNPFYIEEMINSLIESEILTRDNGNWKLMRKITEADIPTTLQGVITARVDRLGKHFKQILQEASVIGRVFLYKILERITDIDSDIDQYLGGLEGLDLIRTQLMEPELEYIFKHALTQEVVYSGLLKKKRKEIHERIGLVMEQLFHNRLPEFCETLAFHFAQGESLHKAVNYLIKSGEKSLRRYAVEESHQYYQQAYKLLLDKPAKTIQEKELLFDLLNKWSLVYYYRGDFKEQTDLLKSHENEADFVEDKEKRGMFYAWLGFNLLFRWELKESYTYLRKALNLGEETENQLIMGYACSWLTYTCAESAKYDEAVVYWERAQEIAPLFESDHYLFFKSMGGIGHNNFYRGEMEKSFEIGKILLDYGKKRSNIRSLVVGHICMGEGYFTIGDFASAIECFQKAIEVSADPFYSQWPRLFLGVSYVQNGQMQEAEGALKEVISYSQDFGCEIFNTVIFSSLGIVFITNGEMSRGLKMLKEVYQANLEKEYKWGIALLEYILGKVYLQIVEGAGPISLSIVAKNFGFLIKNVPFASKKAEAYFNKAIENAKQIGAKGTLGGAYLDLGLLQKAKKRPDLARKSVSQAIKVFEETGAEIYLKQAKETLASLG